ncbi:PAS domain-containing protein [Eilatimonas milleporae]|uniref:histidine kinase n=1 Tax=Eilatimonas milleporae TaxID=911205 RepID=A0A3M0CDW9_9PROT|nr:PAS domain-containing protein [Eilatimonas milleporae]RMB08024.1 PAS domain S-box-containing protein [Eilatimonas milleporae]
MGKRQDRFDLAIEASGVGLWDWDIVEDSLVWSPRFLEIIGADPDTGTRLNTGPDMGPDIGPSHGARRVSDFFDRLHPDDAARVRAAVNAHLTQRVPYAVDMRMRSDDGGYVWVHARGQAVWNDRGMPVRFAGSIDDVSGRKAIETALIDSETRFELAARGASVGIWDWIDVSRDEEYWSDRFFALLGYEVGEIEPGLKSFASLLHPDDLEATFDLVDAHFRGEAKFEIEYRLKHKTDGYLWFLGTGLAERDSRGKPVRMVGSIMNIHARKMTEKALRESQERYDLAVAGIGAGVWDWPDPRSDNLYWSPQHFTMLGYSADAFQPSMPKFMAMLHPDDTDIVLEALRRHMERYEPMTAEYRIRHRDGHYIWVRGTGQALLDETGAAIRITGSIVDITQEKTATEALRVRERELRLIFDSVPVRIWYKDDKNRILRLNEQAARSMGMTVEEAEGTDTYDLFPDMAKKYHDDDLEVINSGEPKLGIVEEYTPRDGVRGWVMTDKVPFIDRATNKRYVFVSAIDITEQKRVENLLEKKTSDLLASNRELEQFAYVASHDLQEPLRMVAGYCDLLRRRYTDILDEDGKEFIEYAVDGAKRMQSLLSDLLQYSRIGQVDYDQRPTDLNAVLEEVLRDLAGAVAESGATIGIGDMSAVLADHGQIRRVLQNLIQNSLKFRGDGDAIVQVWCEEDGRDVTVKVRDNGIGIKPEYKNRIFQVFQRLHTKEEYQGTGIGLAIAKRIVEKHGGRIWLETGPDGQTADGCQSAPPRTDDSGAGATFAFQLKKPSHGERYHVQSR